MGAEPDILRGAVARLSRCPAWPFRMTASVASLAMGMSETKFLRLYRHIAYEEEGNVYWSARQLMELVDGQFGLPPLSAPADAIASPPRDTSWDDVR